MTLKPYYSNQEFRVQSPVSCLIQPGGAQTLRCGTFLLHIFTPSDLQQLRDQQQQFTDASHPQDKNCLLFLTPASVTSFTLFCSYKVVSQWQRKKKKQQKTPSTFLPLRNLLTGRSCGFLPVQLSLNWGLLSEVGKFPGVLLFFPKLIVEFLNKVHASDLFLSSCRICFSPHNLFHRNQVLEKLKGEGQQHHLQSQLTWSKDHPYCFVIKYPKELWWNFGLIIFVN